MFNYGYHLLVRVHCLCNDRPSVRTGLMMSAVLFKKSLESKLEWPKVRTLNMSRKKLKMFGRSPNRSRATSRSSSASSNAGDRPTSNATSPNAVPQSNGGAFFANGKKQQKKQQKLSAAEQKGGAATNAKSSNAKPNTSSDSIIAKKPSALPSLLDTLRNSSAPILVLPEPVLDEDDDDGRQMSVMSDSGALEDPSPQQTLDFSSMRSSLRSSLDAQATQSNESNGLLVPPPRVPSLCLGPRHSNPDFRIGAGPETRPRNEELTGVANKEGKKRKLLDKRLSLQMPHLRSPAPISPLARESPARFS